MLEVVNDIQRHRMLEMDPMKIFVEKVDLRFVVASDKLATLGGLIFGRIQHPLHHKISFVCLEIPGALKNKYAVPRVGGIFALARLPCEDFEDCE